MFETKSGVFLIAGIGFFLLSFFVMGIVPWTLAATEREKSLDEVVAAGVTHEFVDLAERFPQAFAQYFPDGVTARSYAAALERGHRIYVAEGCWHCHSQFIRPISNEDRRWGPVSYGDEYQNRLQRPVLFGTRRVGPDLIREGGRRSNDWHLAHFYDPRSVVPTSVMPSYRWFFDADGYPNRDGLAMITYIQWLGSWLEEYPYYFGEGPGDRAAPQPHDSSATSNQQHEQGETPS